MILCPVRNTHRFGGKPKVSQWFGENKEFYAKFGSTNGHSGIDFRVRTGTILYAPFDGTVTIQKNHSNYGYNIRIKNERLECILAHLSDFIVVDGQSVGMGDQVALSGGTVGHPGAGLSTGAHLHFAVRHLSPDGKAMYPENGNFGWEDLSPYTINWYSYLKNS